MWCEVLSKVPKDRTSELCRKIAMGSKASLPSPRLTAPVRKVLTPWAKARRSQNFSNFLKLQAAVPFLKFPQIFSNFLKISQNFSKFLKISQNPSKSLEPFFGPSRNHLHFLGANLKIPQISSNFLKFPQTSSNFLKFSQNFWKFIKISRDLFGGHSQNLSNFLEISRNFSRELFRNLSTRPPDPWPLLRLKVFHGAWPHGLPHTFFRGAWHLPQVFLRWAWLTSS